MLQNYFHTLFFLLNPAYRHFNLHCCWKTLANLQQGELMMMYVHFLADQSPESILGSASFSCDMMLLLRHFSLEVAVKPGMWWQHCDARCKKRLCFPTNEVGCWGLHVNWILVEMYILVKAHIDHRGETVHWILVLERAWLPGELSRFLFAFFCFSLWRISLGEDLYFCNEIS